MANYTVRQDGTAANKAAALDGDPSVVSECMSIATVNGQTFSGDDRVQLESVNGGVYRGTRFDPPSGGTSGHPVIIEAYPGHSPKLKGSDDLSTSEHIWTLSGSGTNEYFCRKVQAGVTPDVLDADFEEGDLSEFDGSIIEGSNTLVAAGAAAHDGSYGARATFDGTNENACVYKTISNDPAIYTRAWFKWENMHWNASGRLPFVTVGDGATMNTYFAIYGGGATYYWQVRFNYGSTTVLSQAIGASVPTGWYRVEFYSANGGGAGNDTIRVRVYSAGGSLVWDSGDVTQASVAKNQTRVSFGPLKGDNINPTNGDTCDFDDCAIDSDEWIGWPSYVDPSITDPDDVFGDDVNWTKGSALGSLNDHEWEHGDNDSLGYLTLYVRDDSGPPSPTGAGASIEASQIGTLYINQKHHLTIDGLTFEHAAYYSDGQYIGAVRMETVANCTHITIQNCTARWCYNGIGLKGDYHVLDNCVAEYVAGHGLSVGGSNTRHATYCEIKNSLCHHARIDVPGGWSTDYGFKLLYADYSLIHGCEAYSTGLGIDVDGDMGDPTHGSNYNDIYENYFHENAACGIHHEWWCHDNKCYRNFLWNNGRTKTGVDTAEYRESYAGDNSNPANNELFNNVIAVTSAGVEPDPPRMVMCEYGAKIYNNTIYGGGICERGVMMDGGANSTPKGCKIKNNIIDQTTLNCISYNSSHGEGFDGLEIDYNCYRRSDANPDVCQRQYVNLTIAEHCSGYSQDCNSVNADPKFTNPATKDFTLQSDSPCRDAGVNLGAAYKYGLDPTSSWPDAVATLDQGLHGAGWEIGAFVYEDASVAGTLTLMNSRPYPALGGNRLGANSRVVCPQLNDTGSCPANSYTVIRRIQVPSAGNFQLQQRVLGADEITYDMDSAGKPILYENVTARITGENADVVTDDDIQIKLDAADGEIWSNGTSDGTTSAIAHLTGATWQVAALGTGGGVESIEFWPLYLELPFRI